jgi:hypothetical protein
MKAAMELGRWVVDSAGRRHSTGASVRPLRRHRRTCFTIHSTALPNGLVVQIVENHALPLVAMRVVIEGGSLLDPTGKDGLSRSTRWCFVTF